MKKIIAIAAIALMGLAQSAAAEGLYGYVLANRTFAKPTYNYLPGDSTSFNANGNGVTVGFGKSLSQNVAIEGDISAGDYKSNHIEGGTTPCLVGEGGCEMKADWLATLRVTARTQMGKMTPYITAGVAAGHVKGIADGGACGSTDCGFSDTQTGIALGLGTDYALSDRISLRAELMNIVLDSPDFSAPSVTSGGFAFSQLRVGMKINF